MLILLSDNAFYSFLAGTHGNINQVYIVTKLFEEMEKGLLDAILHCYMTGENPVSWLAQFVFINPYVYLETGLNRSIS